ncbi:MAG: hypothetical protein R3Y59_09345 [bacterium]
MRHYILTALLLVNILTINAQTPFDIYAPEHRDKVIIELQNDEPFRVENADTESKARYAEFDSKTLCINILDSANNIIAVVVLEPDDKKFMTIDPLSDKYPSTSPYAYCNNNPVMFVDYRGDSISISPQYRNNVNNALSAVFGTAASNFSYTQSGMLTHNGNMDGLNRKQSKILQGLMGVMNETTITNIIYSKDTYIMSNDGSYYIYADTYDSGGAGAVLASEWSDLSQNTILIDPNIQSEITIYKVNTAYYEYNGNPNETPHGTELYAPQNIKITPTDVLFHELGHIIYQGKPQNKVIDYNNLVRRLIGLNKRPYDDTHNSLIK